MAVIKCKMCGGDIQLAEDKTFGTCEYCGSVMTLPKISDDQRAAAFNRGNHFRRVGEFDKALAVYERIVAEDDGDAEAHWCCALCRFGIEYVEDPATYEWLPTCHRASFDSFLEDVDYLAALEHSDGITRRQYQKDAAKIAEVQRGILAASQNAEPYDVFISYKELDAEGNRTRDSILAQEIYYQLTEKGWRVFFSRISLEDVPGTQYEPYIFAALNSAKVMIVVGTSAENLNAVWVKNEWSRYLSLMRRDRSKLLVPCYRDMDPYDLPEQLSVLMSYDMGKIGFIQDLIRGVDKVLNAEKPKEPAAAAPVQERVIVQQSGGGPNIPALLKRGQQALEDDDWARAKDFYEQVLSMDAENGDAFLGLALAEKQCRKIEDYFALLDRISSTDRGEDRATVARAGDHIRAQLESLAIPGYLEQEDLAKLYDIQKTYPLTASRQKARNASALAELDADRSFARALRYSSDEAKQLRERLKSAFAEREKSAEEADRKAKQDAEAAYRAALEQADRTAAEKHRAASERREADYQAACAAMDGADTEAKFQACIPRFKKLKGYKDSAERIEQCKKQSAVIQEAKEKAAAERRAAEKTAQERAAAEKRRRTRNTLIALLICAALAVGAYFGYTRVYVPMQQYKAAEELLAAEKFEEAAAAFGALGSFRNSADRVEEAIELAHVRDYAAAKALLATGKYEEAAAAFRALGKYRDSAARVEEAVERANARDYAAAEALLAAEKYEEAAAAFGALGDYRDSAARVDEAVNLAHARDYAAAEKLLAAEKYEEAAVAFLELGGYRDAREKSFALWAQIALRETVSAGSLHTVGLKADGSVVAVGRNDNGQCDVGGWRGVIAVAAGNFHTVGLKADGTVVAAGDNLYGQCEVDSWQDVVVAVAAGGSHTAGLKADGTVVAVGSNSNGQCEVGGWTNTVAVAAGDYHTVGLKADGTVVAVGNNDYGQCGVGGWRDIVAVAAGENHTVGLKADGTVVAVGSNVTGQCDVGGWRDIVAVAAGGYHTVGLKADGTIVAVGSNGSGQCKVGGWTDIVAVAAGNKHTVGLKGDGTVVAVGSNGNSQCAVSGWTDIRVPNS